MKKLIFSLILTVALITPSAVSAEEKEVICSQSYGQPVVCGVKTPTEEPIIVETGLMDDPRMLGVALMTLGVGAYFFSNRITSKRLA